MVTLCFYRPSPFQWLQTHCFQLTTGSGNSGHDFVGMKCIRNPLFAALLLQLIGAVVAIHRNCLNEAMFASILFWLLIIKMYSRTVYPKGDVLVVRFGLLFLLVIVIGLWGW